MTADEILRSMATMRAAFITECVIDGKLCNVGGIAPIRTQR
jgi:hypothetical protein